MKYFTLYSNILLLKVSLPIKSQTVANLLTVDWTLAWLVLTVRKDTSSVCPSTFSAAQV